MTVIDPGHAYELATLDGDGSPEQLTFVKREGPGFPGSIGYHSGTTLQEVLRACIDRVLYLDAQIADDDNKLVIANLESAIWGLEIRAAQRHHRPIPTRLESYSGRQCANCLHVGCKGECQK